ncbi:MAG: hypothetical protein MOGMAGMI_01873 [Candidatus Omnitrophica bacterium]|nr:hypothetical protein [Candidatus Omnitrophota bacterium]
MPAMVVVRIDGLEQLRAKLRSERADPPMQRFLDRGAIFIQGQARTLAPVDTNRLRGSIAVETTGRLERSIGTNVTYAPYVELGSRPHFVPAKYIGRWAEKHGFGNTGIFVSGKAQPYLKPAAEAGEGFIRQLVPILAAEIEAAYQ